MSKSTSKDVDRILHHRHLFLSFYFWSCHYTHFFKFFKINHQKWGNWKFLPSTLHGKIWSSFLYFSFYKTSNIILYKQWVLPSNWNFWIKLFNILNIPSPYWNFTHLRELGECYRRDFLFSLYNQVPSNSINNWYFPSKIAWWQLFWPFIFQLEE